MGKHSYNRCYLRLRLSHQILKRLLHYSTENQTPRISVMRGIVSRNVVQSYIRCLVIERPNDVDVVSYAIALCFVGDCERAIGCTVWVLWRGPVGLGDTLDGAVGGA